MRYGALPPITAVLLHRLAKLISSSWAYQKEKHPQTGVSRLSPKVATLQLLILMEETQNKYNLGDQRPQSYIGSRESQVSTPAGGGIASLTLESPDRGNGNPM
jgi:hypothetical protein